MCGPIICQRKKPITIGQSKGREWCGRQKKVFASLENVAKNEETSKTMGFYLADSFIATDTHSSVGCENSYSSEAIETFLLLLPFSSSFIFLLLKNPERLNNTHWDWTPFLSNN